MLTTERIKYLDQRLTEIERIWRNERPEKKGQLNLWQAEVIKVKEEVKPYTKAQKKKWWNSLAENEKAEWIKRKRYQPFHSKR